MDGKAPVLPERGVDVRGACRAQASRRLSGDLSPGIRGRRGCTCRANRGYGKDSSPENWIGKFASLDVHILLFLFAQTEDVLEAISHQIRDLCCVCAAAALIELSVHDARSLPENKAHFGYRDGFAQPVIEGGLPPLMPDVLPKAPAGEFLFGYPSQYDDFTYPLPQPDSLGRNGSFVAFRILAQDCDAFEQFLTQSARQTSLDRELIAAKLCGRWRNGVPLSLSPQSSGEEIPLEGRNTFDYAPSASVPDAFDDARGYRCPLGSHIRRMNPRSSMVAGNGGLSTVLSAEAFRTARHMILRSRMTGWERGLLGLFIGVSLKDQFEFLMAQWANGAGFAPGLGDTRDPVIGDNSYPGSAFLIPVEHQKRPIVLSGMSRFVTCRGAAYGFLPSATALRYISSLSP